jgi:hypothetical protein
MKETVAIQRGSLRRIIKKKSGETKGERKRDWQ